MEAVSQQVFRRASPAGPFPGKMPAEPALCLPSAFSRNFNPRPLLRNRGNTGPAAGRNAHSSISVVINDPAPSQRVPVLLALATLLIAWALSFLAWETARSTAVTGLQAEFESMVLESSDRIVRQLGVYEQILRASRGFLRGSTQVSEEEYRTYVENLNLDLFFPGIQGIGLTEIVRPENKAAHEARVRVNDARPGYEIWPPGQRPLYTSVTRIEPLDFRNLRALGYDMYSEPVRRRAMERARDTGETAMTGKVRLVQEGTTDVQPGFLMYLPIYAPDMPRATETQRRAAILGWIYAPFRMHDFIQGLGGAPRPGLELTVYDGGVATSTACMYGCTRDAADEPTFRTSRSIENAGRTWLLEFRSAPAFETRMDRGLPRLIFAGGLMMGLLLAALVWVLATGRGRALALADRITRELRQSHGRIEVDQRRMRSILESSLDAFVAMDSAGCITDWNAAATGLFGWSAQQAIGQRLAALLAIRVDGRPIASVGELLAQGATRMRREVSARHKDGREIPAELSLAHVKSDSGTIAHAFIRDLSAEKENQQREAQQRRALDEARAALQHAQRLEAVGKLTGGVAHDFNNVLQIISANIQLMQHFSSGDPQLEGRLDSVMKAVDRGARLSSQLLSFARRQPLQPQVVDLYALLRDMRDLIRRAVGDEIEIRIMADEGLGNTVVDPSQFENVLLNLAINARDAMNGRGKLVLELRNTELRAQDMGAFPDLEPGSYVMMAISDTGSGMSPEVIEHAFEPFFTTKERGEGTGLGLSMAYGFVRQSGGHINLQSEVGKGTTVRIYLPRSEERETIVHPHEEPGGSTKPRGNETILVVEDDREVQSTVVSLLSELGYRVLTADNGEQAVPHLREENRIDLLFTDVVMPGAISSTDLAREARALQPGIAVLYTSGYTQDAIVHNGRLDPGVHLLGKPYRADELAHRVRMVLDANDKEKRDSIRAR